MCQPADNRLAGFVERRTAQLDLPYFEYAGSLEQSPNDVRQHRLIRLPNNMTVICTSDKDAALAAAFLRVNVGSLIDPPELQGLAHFLEHMMFRGSEKYPDEAEIMSFTNSNGGNYNAMTYDDKTTYYFKIANGALDGLLDRLAHMLICPLFTTDAIDSEVLSVDSEFKGYLQDDEERFLMLERTLSDPAHPHSQFDVGNLHTLKEAAIKLGVSLRDNVAALFHKYYSADIMKLAIIGNHPIDELIELAVAKFSPVASKGNTSLYQLDQPLVHSALGRVVHYQRVGSESELTVQFATPGVKGTYTTNPSYYIEMLITRNDPGSLLQYAKANDLATKLKMNFTDFGNYSTTFVTFALTDKGLQHYVDLLKALFAYLTMLTEQEPQKWLYNEFKIINNLEFTHHKPPKEIDWVKLLATGTNSYIKPEHILTNNMLLREFNADAITMLLAQFVQDNCRVFVGACNNNSKNNSIEYTREELHYGILYNVDNLPQFTLDYHVFGFTMPKPNKFIPENLQLVDNCAANAGINPVPTLLQMNNQYEVWFKQNDKHPVPYGSVMLQILLPEKHDTTIQDKVVTQVVDACIGNMMSKLYQCSKRAGISCYVDFSACQTEIVAHGFSEKLALVLYESISALKSTKFTKDMFDSAKRQVQQHINGDLNSQPYIQLAFNVQRHVNHKSSWLPSELTDALKNVTTCMAQKALAVAFTSGYFKLLVCGNFQEQHAIELANSVNSMLDLKPAEKPLHTPYQILSLETGHYLHCMQANDSTIANNAAVTLIYCGPYANVKERMAITTIAKLISTPFFDQLRTKEQLGYIVYSSILTLMRNRMAIEFDIQGNSNPAYLTQRIGNFVSDFRAHILKLPLEILNSVVDALIASRNAKPASVKEEANHFWKAIDEGTYNFHPNKQEISCLRNITRDYLLEIWDKYINSRTATNYTRLDMQMWSKATNISSVEDIMRYPEQILSLHACLLDENIVNIDLDKLCQLLSGKGLNDVDAVLKELAVDIKEGSKIKSALSMALQSTTVPADFGLKRPGLGCTADGRWVIRDIEAFKATQKLCELPQLDMPLAPKFA